MRRIFALVILVFANGCTSGDLSKNVFKQLASLKPGVSSRNDVVRLMGSPEGERQLFNESRLLYGVRTSANIKVPQIIVAIDPLSQKVKWVSYINFDQKLNLSTIGALYPNAKFVKAPPNPHEHRDFVSTDRSYSDNILGIYFTTRENDAVKSIGWGLPQIAQIQETENSVTNKKD